MMRWMLTSGARRVGAFMVTLAILSGTAVVPSHASSARNLPTLQQIEIQVTDTGKGIAQDKIPLIFDLFRQLDSSSTRRHGGIGLGLYLAKKHVQLLGGDLTVQSQLGKGSTFSVLLPVH